MRFPADIRIDTPQRVWLAVLAVTAIVLCTSLFVMTIVLWFYGTANLVVAYLIAGLVPVLAAPPVIYVIARAAYQLYQTQEELWRLVQTDDLTGLLNRRAFFSRGHEIIVPVNGVTPPVALLLLDADEFKQINDTLGHVAGDEALRYLANVIRACAAPTDVVARFGGDEFAVLRANATSADLARLADRIGECLASRAYSYGQESRTLRMSAGIADTGDIKSFDALLLAADLALYEAKEKYQAQPPTMRLPMHIYAAFSISS